MLRNVLFDLALFNDDADRKSSQKRVLVLLEALTLCDEIYLSEHPDTPLMYDLASKGKLKYKLPAQFDSSASAEGGVPGYHGEVFRDIPRIIENGGGDCDNVASWRAAEIRHRLGIATKPYITWRKRPDGGTTYHVIVLWPDGSSEDPSLLLGMGGADRDKDRREEERKLGERAGEMIAALKQPATSVDVTGDNLSRILEMQNLRALFSAQHRGGK